MTWPVYAEFMGMKLSTLYKIAKGRVRRPHELTLDAISEKLQLPINPEGGDGGEVVPK